MINERVSSMAAYALGAAVAVVACGAAPAFSAAKSGARASVGGSADVDGDGDVDLDDYRTWLLCMDGPGVAVEPGDCSLIDLDNDADVDLADFAIFENVFNPSVPPAGDQCGEQVAISEEGAFSFNNATATRDGPSHAECAARGQDQISNDVWMCWQAPCTGLVVVETCELTTIDSKIAVYSGCSCPATDARLVACNDDFCGVQSRAAFQASFSASYLIRVGTLPGTPGGSGEIRIFCGFDPCETSSADCFTPHAGTGCQSENCCNTVCASDPLCCEAAWDDACAAEAAGLCNGNFENCGSLLSPPCDEADAVPGCQDADCCNAICSNDPFCCLTEWDQLCADQEATTCFQACETSVDSCFLQHPTPGCSDESCCAEVCPRDPFCCQTDWDESCVALASMHCN